MSDNLADHPPTKSGKYFLYAAVFILLSYLSFRVLQHLWSQKVVSTTELPTVQVSNCKDDTQPTSTQKSQCNADPIIKQNMVVSVMENLKLADITQANNRVMMKSTAAVGVPGMRMAWMPFPATPNIFWYGHNLPAFIYTNA